MIHLRRSPLRPTIDHVGDAFVVRYVDGSGRPREQSFRTKREARYFVHQFAKVSSDDAIHDAEIDWLNAENTGCFARNVGPAADVYRHERR